MTGVIPSGRRRAELSCAESSRGAALELAEHERDYGEGERQAPAVDREGRFGSLDAERALFDAEGQHRPDAQQESDREQRDGPRAHEEDDDSPAAPDRRRRGERGRAALRGGG